MSGAVSDPGSIKIRTAHEVIAARAAELALLVVQFVAAARAPAPVFAGRRLAAEFTFHSGFHFRAGVLFERHARDFLSKRLPQTSSPFAEACGTLARDDSLV